MKFEKVYHRDKAEVRQRSYKNLTAEDAEDARDKRQVKKTLVDNYLHSSLVCPQRPLRLSFHSVLCFLCLASALSLW